MDTGVRARERIAAKWHIGWKEEYPVSVLFSLPSAPTTGIPLD
jgi:hypothetical protein